MNNLEESRKKINEIDKEMRELFLQRLKVVEDVARYKKLNNLNIYDEKREKEVIEKNIVAVDKFMQSYYYSYITKVMDISKEYQGNYLASANTIFLNYPIIVENGSINKFYSYFNIKSKILVITDKNVPTTYINCFLKKDQVFVYTIGCGENNKTMNNILTIIDYLIDNKFTREDCIVAVGGGMVCDLASFAASIYMRGIKHYLVPTTLLAQVDASIGGKTAINYQNLKNVIGTFNNPSGVLIDPLTLNSLSKRLFNEGMAEVIKMSIVHSPTFFDYLLTIKEPYDITYIIKEAISIKKMVVEKDFKDLGLRKTLNFGHTIGHAIEAITDGKLYHGECVALGMLYMCDKEVYNKLYELLKKFSLPTNINLDTDTIISKVVHDKKNQNNNINIIYVDKIGHYINKNITLEELRNLLEEKKKELGDK